MPGIHGYFQGFPAIPTFAVPLSNADFFSSVPSKFFSPSCSCRGYAAGREELRCGAPYCSTAIGTPYPVIDSAVHPRCRRADRLTASSQCSSQLLASSPLFLLLFFCFLWYPESAALGMYSVQAKWEKVVGTSKGRPVAGSVAAWQAWVVGAWHSGQDCRWPDLWITIYRLLVGPQIVVQ